MLATESLIGGKALSYLIGGKAPSYTCLERDKSSEQFNTQIQHQGQQKAHVNHTFY